MSGLGIFVPPDALLSIDSVSAPVLSPLLVSFAIGPYMLLSVSFPRDADALWSPMQLYNRHGRVAVINNNFIFFIVIF